MQKYVVVNNSKKEVSKLNEWFRFCENNDLPYIFVEKRGKFWRVEYDLIALAQKYGFNLDDSVKKEITALFKRYLKPYEDYLRQYGKRKYQRYYLNADIIHDLDIGRFRIMVGTVFGCVKGLSTKEEAMNLADELYDLLSGYISKRHL